MSAVSFDTVVSSLQTVAGGQPRALERLVTQYAQNAALQLVPAEATAAAAALPFDWRDGHLAFNPQKLEGAFEQVLGALSPGALRTLQRLTQLLPGGLPGLPGTPTNFLTRGWFGQVGSHLLSEAAGPELQQFVQTGQQVLLASAGPNLPLAGTGLGDNPALLAATPEPAAADKANAKPKAKKKPAAAPRKPPVKTGWLDAKKEEYEQRMELIDEAEARRGAIDNPAFNRALKRLKQDTVALERWRLSVDVYNYQAVRNPTAANFAQAKALGYKALEDVPARNGQPRTVLFHKGTPLPGWTVERVWDDQSTGLNALLYRSTFERGGQPVLVFAGTEINRIGGPKIPVDVLTDYNQAHTTQRPFGFRVPIARQYAQGIALGQQVAVQYPHATVTGHSLGGGLASAVGVLTPLKAYTFNAAGLHPDTVAPYGVSREELARRAGRVEAYHSSGDQLHNFQAAQQSDDNPFRMYRGDDVPQAIGNQRTVGTGPHGPGGTGIEEALVRQQAADEATLRRFLAGR